MSEQRISGRQSGPAFEAAWASDVGCRRECNEDNCAVEDGLLIVSDGMGGESAGDVASRLVVRWLPELLREHLAESGRAGSDDAQAALRDAVIELNHRVRSESSQLRGPGKMGATVVAAVPRGESVYVANVGDSRAYLFGEGKLARLTHDHSVVGVLLRRGAITPDQAACHPMRGQLSRYVGMGGDATADVQLVPWPLGSRLLLATDGLTDEVDEDWIARILVRYNDLLDACHALADAAREAGGRDNITVLLARRTAQPRPETHGQLGLGADE